MQTNSFKTNINCAGCIARVTDTLNQVAGKENWTVDTENPDKVLTVTNHEADQEAIIKAVQAIGFKIEPLGVA